MSPAQCPPSLNKFQSRRFWLKNVIQFFPRYMEPPSIEPILVQLRSGDVLITGVTGMTGKPAARKSLEANNVTRDTRSHESLAWHKSSNEIYIMGTGAWRDVHPSWSVFVVCTIFASSSPFVEARSHLPRSQLLHNGPGTHNSISVPFYSPGIPSRLNHDRIPYPGRPFKRASSTDGRKLFQLVITIEREISRDKRKIVRISVTCRRGSVRRDCWM